MKQDLGWNFSCRPGAWDNLGTTLEAVAAMLLEIILRPLKSEMGMSV